MAKKETTTSRQWYYERRQIEDAKEFHKVWENHTDEQRRFFNAFMHCH